MEIPDGDAAEFERYLNVQIIAVPMMADSSHAVRYGQCGLST